MLNIVSFILLIILTIYLFLILRPNKYKHSQNLKKEAKENRILKSKKNELIVNILELAKNNAPIFYIKFNEVFVDFDQVLSRKHPQLSTFEKCFLAMIFLNFSNKELANIESVSLKTIEIRKYRIRKKCNLELGQDLKKWLDDLLISKTNN